MSINDTQLYEADVEKETRLLIQKITNETKSDTIQWRSFLELTMMPIWGDIDTAFLSSMDTLQNQWYRLSYEHSVYYLWENGALYLTKWDVGEKQSGQFHAGQSEEIWIFIKELPHGGLLDLTRRYDTKDDLRILYSFALNTVRDSMVPFSNELVNLYKKFFSCKAEIEGN